MGVDFCWFHGSWVCFHGSRPLTSMEAVSICQVVWEIGHLRRNLYSLTLRTHLCRLHVLVSSLQTKRTLAGSALIVSGRLDKKNSGSDRPTTFGHFLPLLVLTWVHTSADKRFRTEAWAQFLETDQPVSSLQFSVYGFKLCLTRGVSTNTLSTKRTYRLFVVQVQSPPRFLANNHFLLL